MKPTPLQRGILKTNLEPQTRSVSNQTKKKYYTQHYTNTYPKNLYTNTFKLNQIAISYAHHPDYPRISQGNPWSSSLSSRSKLTTYAPTIKFIVFGVTNSIGFLIYEMKRWMLVRISGAKSQPRKQYGIHTII
jgi:hypothetical protein